MLQRCKGKGITKRPSGFPPPFCSSFLLVVFVVVVLQNEEAKFSWRLAERDLPVVLKKLGEKPEKFCWTTRNLHCPSRILPRKEEKGRKEVVCFALSFSFSVQELEPSCNIPSAGGLEQAKTNQGGRTSYKGQRNSPIHR